MNKRTTNQDEDPLPASNPAPSIKMLNPERQKTREGASERGNAEHHGEAELHGMALIEAGKEEHDAREEAT